MATSKYLDFDLHIWREGDLYKAEVRDSPAGPSGKVQLRWPFGTEPHDALLDKLELAVIKSQGVLIRGGPLTSEERVLRQFGNDVFRAVFQTSGAVSTKFAASLDMVRLQADAISGLRLKLHVDPPELATLPWEFMFDESTQSDDPQNFLCLRNRSPLVRFLDVEGPLTTLRVNGPLRILGMIANPGGEGFPRLDTEAERHRIEAALKEIPKGAVQFEWVPGGSPDDLFNYMQNGSWHIFHFIGHGGIDQYVDDQGEARAEGFVAMQDGLGGAVKVSASQLGFMLQGDNSLRLAVLNCCDSARTFSSAGAALVRSGVPMAVAMQFAIRDGVAARFAGMFYKKLISGESVERALTVARQFMRLESNLEWGIPVLFTRTGSSVLLEVEPREPAGAGAAAPAAPVAAPPVEAPARRTQAQEELRRLFA